MATGKATGKRTGELTVRKCEALEEMQACFALQKEVWKFSDAELVPVRIFVLANKIGGHVIGAFDGDELIGFAMAIPGVRNRRFYLHSHMLAVRQEYRNGGVGRRLKLYQRDEALARGVDLMEWTFDPLEIKNAYLNVEKLGAIARRYNINQYGITTSPLQGGLPTDRLVAEWWLKSRRVEAVLKNEQHSTFETKVKISVPAEIYQWKASDTDRTRALDVQQHNRTAFLQAFERGFAVLGYVRGPHGSGTFLLGPWDEGWTF